MSDGRDFEAESRSTVTATTQDSVRVAVVSDGRDFDSKSRTILRAAATGPKVAAVTHDDDFGSEL